LFWLAERGELPASPASPLSLADFVLMRLCDGPPATERTMALGTLNLATRDWHRGVFEKLGLARLRWPVLVEAASPVGQFEYGGRRIPCYPALGDQQCALAGALLQEGELSLNISTGSQVSRILPTWRPGDYQTRPYFDGRLLDTITHLPAGRSLNVLVDLLTELASAQGQALADPWPYIARVAAEAADTDLTVDLAFFAGPLGERGMIGNITVDNLTIGTLFRSALRSMAANYETCAARLFPVRDWQRIVLSGGLPQRVDVLRAFIGERLPGPQRMSAAAEETLTGLLVVGLVAMGRARSVAESSAMMG
jgi:hypothetical protein